MKAVIVYDWLETTEWATISECLRDQETIEPELADYESVDNGLILFQRDPAIGFAMAPLSMCEFMSWLLLNHAECEDACPFFVQLCEEELVVDRQDDVLTLYAVQDSPSSQAWRHLLGEPIPRNLEQRPLVTSYRLVPPNASPDTLSGLPGITRQHFSLTLQEWRSAALTLAEQFHSLLSVALQVMSAKNPDRKTDTEINSLQVMRHFYQQFPKVRDELESTAPK